VGSKRGDDDRAGDGLRPRGRASLGVAVQVKFGKAKFGKTRISHL
jgi:hypothetical protein